MNAPEAIITQLQQYFAAHCDEYAAAFLFGSVARNDARSDSDLDIAIVPNRRQSAELRLKLIMDLGKLSGRPVDVVDLTSANGPVLKQALTTGVCVHRNDPDAVAEVAGRMLAYETDLAPLVQAAEKRIVDAWLKS